MKKLVSMILCLAALLSLCGCGSRNAPVTHEVDMGGYSVQIKSLDLTFSEYISRGETIWYRLDENKGKDSDVEMIFVLEPDGTMYYTDRVSETLGELEQMEDEAICAMVKEEHRRKLLVSMVGTDLSDEAEAREWLEHILFYEAIFVGGYENCDMDFARCCEVYPVLAEAVGEEMESLNAVYGVVEEMLREIWGSEIWDQLGELLCSYVEVEEMEYVIRNEFADYPQAEFVADKLQESYSLLPAAVDAVYQNLLARAENMDRELQPVPYRLAITTDPTGNNTASMLFAYQVIKNGEAYYDSFNLYYQYPITDSEGITTNCTTVVYDSVYGGYSDDGDLFFTRVDRNAHFMLDSLGGSDLPVDVKRARDLFE